MYIIQIALPIPNKCTFDYLIPSNTIFNIGCRVLIPFRKKKIVGIIVSIKDNSLLPLFKLKKIYQIIDKETLFTPYLFKTLVWGSKYYHFSLGKLLFKCIPKILQNNKISEEKNKYFIKKKLLCSKNKEKLIKFNLPILNLKNSFKVYFLSSKNKNEKNKFYIKTIKKIISDGYQILIMMPEIDLINDFFLYLKKHFNFNIDILNSNIKDKEKLNIWNRCIKGENNIIIGTRSSLFIPFIKLGLIIIEEEHNSSYKSKKGFRYQARDMAIVYAKKINIPIIIHSNYPSLETILNIKKGKYISLCINKKTDLKIKINHYLIDINYLELKGGLSCFAIKKILDFVKKNKKILIFCNKLGFASELFCNKCNWVAQCKECEHFYTVHYIKNFLQCHYCNNKINIPFACLKCNSKDYLTSYGLGTEKIENFLKNLLPDVFIYRIDSDNIKNKKKINNFFEKQNQPQIIIGTRLLLTKYFYVFSYINLVIFTDIDKSFFALNFRSIEKFAQDYFFIIDKMDTSNSEILLQTRNKNNYLINKLILSDYDSFALILLKNRKKMMLPPFTYHALIRIKNEDFQKVVLFMKQLINLIKKNNKDNQLYILGPNPSLSSNKNKSYQWQIILQHISRVELHNVLKKIIKNINKLSNVKKINWLIDVDPIDI